MLTYNYSYLVICFRFQQCVHSLTGTPRMTSRPVASGITCSTRTTCSQPVPCVTSVVYCAPISSAVVASLSIWYCPWGLTRHYCKWQNEMNQKHHYCMASSALQGASQKSTHEHVQLIWKTLCINSLTGTARMTSRPVASGITCSTRTTCSQPVPCVTSVVYCAPISSAVVASLSIWYCPWGLTRHYCKWQNEMNQKHHYCMASSALQGASQKSTHEHVQLIWKTLCINSLTGTARMTSWPIASGITCSPRTTWS